MSSRVPQRSAGELAVPKVLSLTPSPLIPKIPRNPNPQPVSAKHLAVKKDVPLKRFTKSPRKRTASDVAESFVSEFEKGSNIPRGTKTVSFASSGRGGRGQGRRGRRGGASSASNAGTRGSGVAKKPKRNSLLPKRPVIRNKRLSVASSTTLRAKKLKPNPKDLKDLKDPRDRDGKYENILST